MSETEILLQYASKEYFIRERVARSIFPPLKRVPQTRPQYQFRTVAEQDTSREGSKTNKKSFAEQDTSKREALALCYSIAHPNSFYA